MCKRNVALLLIAALALRLWLAFASQGAAYDIESYRIQGQAVLNGQNIYTVTYRYPYLPLWMYVPAASLVLSSWTGLPFHFWVKLPEILADLGIGWLLLCWPQPRGVRRAEVRAALYLFNPVVLLVSAAHGQFDSIAIFLVLLSAWLLIEHQSWMKEISSALGLGIAIALKGFPILLLPAFVLSLSAWTHILLYGIVAVGILGLVVLPYLAPSGGRILNIILAYNSVSDHSYGYLLNYATPLAKQWLVGVRSISRWLQGSATLVVTSLSAIGHQPIEWRITLVLIAIYAVSPGLASQQMIWVLPFLVLVQRHSIWIYTAFSTVALVLFYGQYFPAVLLLSTAWSGQWLALGRLAAEAGWWLCVVGVLLTTLVRIALEVLPVRRPSFPAA
jgi:Gpi18-like mannosyltransferase